MLGIPREFKLVLLAVIRWRLDEGQTGGTRTTHTHTRSNVVSNIAKVCAFFAVSLPRYRYRRHFMMTITVCAKLATFAV